MIGTQGEKNEGGLMVACPALCAPWPLGCCGCVHGPSMGSLGGTPRHLVGFSQTAHSWGQHLPRLPALRVVLAHTEQETCVPCLVPPAWSFPPLEHRPRLGQLLPAHLGTCHLWLKAGPTPGFPAGGGKWKMCRTGVWDVPLCSCGDGHRSGHVSKRGRQQKRRSGRQPLLLP